MKCSTRFSIHFAVHLIAYLVLLLVSAQSSGQEKQNPPLVKTQPAAQDDLPAPRITGPQSARCGDIIILDASGSTAEFYDWLVDDSGVSLPNDDAMKKARQSARELRARGFEVKEPKAAVPTSYMVMEGGKKLLLASYPGTWRISLAVSNSKGVRQLPWRVVVTGGDSPPIPPPNGGPNPPPNGGPKPPEPPPGLNTNFSADAKTWLATVPAASRNFVATTNNPKKLTVQQNLKETLNEIGASWKQIGSIAGMETLLNVGIQATFTPLGAKAADWKSFATSANAVLDGLKAKGATPAQYGAALVSIAKGLE